MNRTLQAQLPFVIHIWQATRQETRCGLWFKSVPSLQKPNLISILVAMKIDAAKLGGILCKNCVRACQSLNPNILRESGKTFKKE